MTTSGVVWEKRGKDAWTAVVNGQRLWVTRSVVKRSHTVRTGCMSWQKYRAWSSTTVVRASCRFLGKTTIALLKPSNGDVLFDVRGAKAALEHFARTGVGTVDSRTEVDADWILECDGFVENSANQG